MDFRRRPFNQKPLALGEIREAIRRYLRPFCDEVTFQFTGKCWKVDFLMPCKTKSCQSSREKLRMLRVLPPDTPRPPQFQPELWKNQFLWKTRFSRFTNRSLLFATHNTTTNATSNVMPNTPPSTIPSALPSATLRRSALDFDELRKEVLHPRVWVQLSLGIC